MPVILDERMAEDWMNPRETNPLSLKQLLVPTPSDLLLMQAASPLANNAKKRSHAPKV
jgi:putative SOS response-associated peptidase YedK